MDLHFIAYEHPYHFPIFWKIFQDFWESANHEDLQGLKTVKMPDGGYTAVTNIEEKLVSLIKQGWKTKFVYDAELIKVIGFLQYEIYSNSVLFVHSAYIIPEYREKGIGGFMVRSFGKGRQVMFHTFKDTPPAELLGCAKNTHRVCDSPHDVRLELWQGELEE